MTDSVVNCAISKIHVSSSCVCEFTLPQFICVITLVGVHTHSSFILNRSVSVFTLTHHSYSSHSCHRQIHKYKSRMAIIEQRMSFAVILVLHENISVGRLSTDTFCIISIYIISIFYCCLMLSVAAFSVLGSEEKPGFRLLLHCKPESILENARYRGLVWPEASPG